MLGTVGPTLDKLQLPGPQLAVKTELKAAVS